MGKKKTTQTQSGSQNFNTANTYGWQETPDTKDIEAFRNWKPQVDPGLSYQYGNARNKLRSSFINPLGGYATPQMQDALQRSGERALNQDEAQAYRGGQYDVNNQRSGQLGMLAGLTAPRLTQTGSSGSGTSSGTTNTSQSGGLFGDILGAGSQVASAGLLGKNRRT